MIHKSSVFFLLSILIVLVGVLTGCTARGQAPVVSASVVEAMRAPDNAAYARAIEPYTFNFPADHGAHPAYRTEWWYYTGNLQTDAGEQLGYQLTFFRSALTPEEQERASTLASNQVYMAHFAISDGRNQQHYSFDRYSRGAGGLAGAQASADTNSAPPRYEIWLEDWRATEIEPGVIQLHAAQPAAAATGDEKIIAIDLTLREQYEPLLHGDAGLHQKGLEPGNASYYYSLVGMETSGSVTTPMGQVEVTGLSWMDHEFGTSALSENVLGWDWFSMQLDSGEKLMLYRFRMLPGAPPIPTQSTLLQADGTQVILSGDEYTIETLDTWQSPRTAITWDSGWRVTIPSRAMELTVIPLFPDQEMQVEFVYWEGAVTIEGTAAGAPVAGRGFVEMTGAGGGAGEYQR